MKQIIEVRSNPYYTQSQDGTGLMTAHMELIIMYLDGKEHKLTKDGHIKSTHTIKETRMIIDAPIFDSLMAQLELHRANMNKHQAICIFD